MHSQGSFTLVWEKALEKFAKFSLERPAAWVLRVIQAAVGLGASEVDVRVSGRYLSIDFGKVRETLFIDLQNAFTQPDSSTTPPALRDLAAGLWSLAYASKRDFLIHAKATLAGRQVWGNLHWINSKLSGDGDPQAIIWQLKVAVSREPESLLSRVAHLFRGGHGFQDELEELRRHAYLCPLTLKVDGLNYTKFLRAAEAVKGVGKDFPLPIFWCTYEPTETLPEIGLPPDWSGRPHFVQKGELWVRKAFSKPEERRVAIVLSLCFDFQTAGRQPANQTSSICWLRGGVIIDRTPLPELDGLGLGMVVFLSAEGLPTDLSGMRLRQDPLEFKERRKASLRALTAGLRECSKDLYVPQDINAPEQALDTCRNELELLSERLGLGPKEIPPPGLTTFGDDRRGEIENPGGFL